MTVLNVTNFFLIYIFGNMDIDCNILLTLEIFNEVKVFLNYSNTI